jgi:hypothetical protein
LLTILTLLSLDNGTVNLQDKFFETASAQVFNNTGNVIQNKIAESTISADRSLLVKLLVDDLENRLNKSAAILEITGELPQVKKLLKECWNIYIVENNKDITWFYKLLPLKLAKECNEALFKLTSEGPSVMYVRLLEERLARIEAREINQ